MVDYYLSVNMCYYFLSHFEFNCCDFEGSLYFSVIAMHPYVYYSVLFNSTE